MIGADTQVTVTMKQLVCTAAAVIVCLGGVLWAVLAFTIGGMRDDVSHLRSQQLTLQTADKDSALRIRESENRLAEQIAGLRTEIATLSGDMKGVNVNMATLNTRLNDMQRQIAQRQTSLQNPENLAKFGNVIKGQLEKSGDAKVLVVPFDSQFFPLQ